LRTLRLIRNNEKLQLTSIIGNNLMAKYDMTAFLVPFWKIILDNVRTGQLSRLIISTTTVVVYHFIYYSPYSANCRTSRKLHKNVD
jgi:hypothetical protein